MAQWTHSNADLKYPAIGKLGRDCSIRMLVKVCVLLKYNMSSADTCIGYNSLLSEPTQVLMYSDKRGSTVLLHIRCYQFIKVLNFV